MLKEKLKELVSACFTGIWIETFEFQEATTEICELCRNEEWISAIWDVGFGLRVGNGEPIADATDPLAAIKAVSSLATPDGTVLLVMNNLHKFVSSTEVIQALQHQLIQGKQNRTIVIGLSGLYKPAGFLLAGWMVAFLVAGWPVFLGLPILIFSFYVVVEMFC